MVDDFASMKPMPGADPEMKASSYEDKPEVEASRAALVTEWIAKARAARKHWKGVFAQMAKCQQIAAEGADPNWIKSDNYVVPIVNRHINQAVAQLYAKNPKAVASRKKRLMYTLWDGRTDTLQAAMEAANPQPPVDPMTGAPIPVDPMMLPPPDPNAIALLQEVADVRTQNDLTDQMAKSMELLWTYFTAEQSAGFKQQMKAAVRRTKVNGVAWAKLAFQREMQPNPEVGARIDDTTAQIARLEMLQGKVVDGDTADDSARIEELRLLLQDLQNQQDIIVREGPIWDWPRSREMYPDPACRHLKTLFGANYLVHEFSFTPEEIKMFYGVDIGCHYTEYTSTTADDTGASKPKIDDDKPTARVYEVQDKQNGQFLTVCEGYPDFLKEPATPDVRIERFFTGFPLVFNETENEKCIYPPSDVWQMRHLQKEYNRAREALREHRVAAAPNYVARKGALSQIDRAALQNAKPHEVIEVKTAVSEDPSNVIKRLEKANIDPNLYEVEQVFADIQRTVGAQEANLGGTGDSTATESSIAEQSRSVSMSENVDDLDEFLSEMAQAFGQLCLMELSKETVVGIVGPGAAWPEMTMSREDIAKDLLLEIKAGSSGRPNAAAELAKMERGMQYLLQIPGVSGEALGKRYAELLDIDVEDLIVDGLPSITAINAMMSKSAGGAPGAPTSSDPAQQGGQGAANDAKAPEKSPQGQPAYPANVTSYDAQGQRVQ